MYVRIIHVREYTITDALHLLRIRCSFSFGREEPPRFSGQSREWTRHLAVDGRRSVVGVWTGLAGRTPVGWRKFSLLLSCFYPGLQNTEDIPTRSWLLYVTFGLGDHLIISSHYPLLLRPVLRLCWAESPRPSAKARILACCVWGDTTFYSYYFFQPRTSQAKPQ